MRNSLIFIVLAALSTVSPVNAEPKVERAQFTSAIADREPVDALETVSTSDGRVRFFTELHDLAGHQVIHRWEHAGQVMAEVTIEVGADRWRAWSSKRLLPAWTGPWQVSVVTADGENLGTWTVMVE